jgi:hypothetical protein
MRYDYHSSVFMPKAHQLRSSSLPLPHTSCKMAPTGSYPRHRDLSHPLLTATCRVLSRQLSFFREGSNRQRLGPEVRAVVKAQCCRPLYQERRGGVQPLWSAQCTDPQVDSFSQTMKNISVPGLLDGNLSNDLWNTSNDLIRSYQ